MRGKINRFLKQGTTPNFLNYLIISRENIAYKDPFFLIEGFLEEFNFGLLILGLDGPLLLSSQGIEKAIKGMSKDGIFANVKNGFLWLPHQEALKLISKKVAICEGNALLFKTEISAVVFAITDLPEPHGFLKDKVSLRNANLLNQLLGVNDLYIYDDFEDCFLVTRNKKIFDSILEKVSKIPERMGKDIKT